MSYKIIKRGSVPHRCDLPKIYLWKPSRMDGMVVQCECGLKWECKFLWDSQGGSYGWTKMYNEGSLAVDLR